MINYTTSRGDCLRKVEACRISTEGQGGACVDELCEVAIEGPVTIDVKNLGIYTVLCTPDDKRAMAVGFLFSEGIIDSIEDIESLRECNTDPDVMRVELSDNAPDPSGKGRNLLIVSSCGLCGSERIEDKLAQMPKVGDTLRIEKDVIRRVVGSMKDHQEIFKECGGTHSIGLYDNNGEIISFAEDIGRHNALDKAIGKCLLQGKRTVGLAAALSGRVSLEMVGKCSKAGIELISAVSAPTSLAIDAAEMCDITLLAFVRDTRATIFSCPRRVL